MPATDERMEEIGSLADDLASRILKAFPELKVTNGERANTIYAAVAFLRSLKPPRASAEDRVAALPEAQVRALLAKVIEAEESTDPDTPEDETWRVLHSANLLTPTRPSQPRGRPLIDVLA